MDRKDKCIIWRHWIIASLLLAGMLINSTAAAGAGPAGPPGANGYPPSVLETPIRFFQDVISPVDGPRCHSYPTCSTYARQSIAKHGAFIGWIMTSDRLMRDGRDDSHLLPRVRIGAQDYANDPVNANDFWWSQKP